MTPIPKPNLSDIQRGVTRYERGDRPWNEFRNSVDWFIALNGELYPLKYTFALATDFPTSEFNTNQAKAAMRHLNLSFHSLKAHKQVDLEFQESVRHSLADSESRTKRLRTADPRPRVSYIYSLVFQRNPDVVAEVLCRAAGKCECCGKPAPFVRASDGSAYLEVHHIVCLADGGNDTVDNAEALCPNCHRFKHYGLQRNIAPQRS